MLKFTCWPRDIQCFSLIYSFSFIPPIFHLSFLQIKLPPIPPLCFLVPPILSFCFLSSFVSLTSLLSLYKTQIYLQEFNALRRKKTNKKKKWKAAKERSKKISISPLGVWFRNYTFRYFRVWFQIFFITLTSLKEKKNWNPFFFHLSIFFPPIRTKAMTKNFFATNHFTKCRFYGVNKSWDSKKKARQVYTLLYIAICLCDALKICKVLEAILKKEKACGLVFYFILFFCVWNFRWTLKMAMCCKDGYAEKENITNVLNTLENFLSAKYIFFNIKDMIKNQK